MDTQPLHQPPHGPRPGPDWYEIRVTGHLAPRWAVRFERMSLVTQDDGTTLIRGPVVDQAALHGLLHQLSDLGLPLVSVVRAVPDPPPTPVSDPTGHTPEEQS